MKIFARAILLSCLLPTSAFAQQALFTDLTFGAAILSDIETIEYDFTFSGDQYVGTASAGLETSFTGGVEVGMRGIGSKHISASISYDYYEANFETLSAMGTINGVPASGSVILSDFDTIGIDLDAESHTFLGNLRYDFVGPRERIQPFIGIGGGVTVINGANTAPTLAATAGIRMPLGHGFYAGVRYRYLRLFEVRDDFGIQYEDADAHLISLTIGALVGAR